MADKFPNNSFVGAGGQTANIVLRLHERWRNLTHVDSHNYFLVNHETHCGILTIASRYACQKSVSHDFRISRDATNNSRLYYRTVASVVKQIQLFFKMHPSYRLLVDVCSKEHQCALYITRSSEGEYKFFGFDPNNDSVSACIVNVVSAMSQRVQSMEVFSSRDNNYDGLCFGMSLYFMYLIFVKGYDPDENERRVRLYYFKAKTSVPIVDAERVSSIAYRRIPKNKRPKEKPWIKFEVFSDVY